MSFSVNVPSTPVDKLPEALDAPVGAYEKVLAQNDSQPTDETLELIEQARAAVLGILDSGKLGAATVAVSITGHANPGHKPVKGWANDSVQINVYSTDPQPVDPPATAPVSPSTPAA